MQCIALLRSLTAAVAVDSMRQHVSGTHATATHRKPQGVQNTTARHESLISCVHAGAYTAGLIDDKEMHDIVRHACPGAGACGGMYTANTMSSAIEALGMSLPYSSSIPAVDPLKKAECRRAGK